jgi:integrase
VTTANLRRRGQTWYARLSVPRALQNQLGREEFVRSLKTRDLAEANRRKHAVLSELQAELQQAVRLAQGAAGSLERIEAAAESMRVQVERGEVDADASEVAMGIVVDEFLDHHALRSGRTESGHPTELPVGATDTIQRAFRQARGHRVDLLSKAVDTHLAELEAAGRRGQTIIEKRRHLNEFRTWLQRDVEVSSITRATAVSYLERNLLNRGHAPKTTEDILGNLSAFFNQLLKRGRVPSNPFAALAGSLPKPKRGVAPRRDKWATDELSKLLVGSSGLPSDDALWSLAAISLYSGMRIEEIASLRVEDVSAVSLKVVEGKTQAGRRDVPIHPVIEPLIARLKANATDEYLVPGLRSVGPDQKRGKLVSKRFGYFIHSKMKLRPQLTFHSLRNTFISQCEVAGLPESTTKLIVGHERESMTYGHYSRGLPMEELTKAVSRVGYGHLDLAIKKKASVVALTKRSKARTTPRL